MRTLPKYSSLKIWTFAMILMSLVACRTENKSADAPSAMDAEETPEVLPIRQEKSALLNGVSKAICYSGFRIGQHPDRGEGEVNPTDEQILEDLNIMVDTADFRLMRLYDSGKNSEDVLRLIKEHNLDIKVMLGIWLKAELSNHETCEWLTEPIPQEVLDKNKVWNLDEIQRGILLAKAYPEVVGSVNVGNEALVDWNDHAVHVDTIIAYVRRVKAAIDQPVTVADNYEYWAKEGAKLAKELDFVAIHVYPVWEGKDIDEAMSFSIQNVQDVRNALPDSKIVISEAGWATIASEFGERAGEEQQQRYYAELMAWSDQMNITTFFFEAFDEPWKGNPDNPMGAEKHWGLFNEDRTPKKVMQDLYYSKH